MARTWDCKTLSCGRNRYVGLERTNPVYVKALLANLRPQFFADPGQTVRQFSFLLEGSAGTVFGFRNSIWRSYAATVVCLRIGRVWSA
jgi:hypothetical protein